MCYEMFYSVTSLHNVVLLSIINAYLTTVLQQCMIIDSETALCEEETK
jgi:hypothetical protein